MRVDHFACAAGGIAGGGQQRHVLIGLDHRDVGRFAGFDHAVSEVVVAHAVEHDHIQRADAFDVFGPGFVGVGVKTGGNQRHHLGLVVDDVAHVAVIGVQGDADAQRFGQRCWAVGPSERGKAAGNQPGQQQGAATQNR